MDQITVEELIQLTEEKGRPSVSIFQPTHRAGAGTEQDPIRLKNLLRDAESKLLEAGVRRPEARDLLKPAEDLLGDEIFWQHQSDGLAIYTSPGAFRFFRVPLGLEELVVAAHRYHIKPLLPLFTADGRFYLLALSQNEIRLLRGTRFGIDEMQLADVPRSLEEALRYDDPERQLQFHTRTPSGGGRRAAVFHGHGGGNDDSKERIFRYFRQIDEGIHEILKREQAPLVLAGVEYLFSIYREANTYPHLVEEGVSGNPEGLSAEELHDRAWEVVEPRFRRGVEQAAGRFQELQGTGRASADLEEVVRASHIGRVETAFVPVNVHVWGSHDLGGDEVSTSEEPKAGDEDLLDLVATRTLRHSGVVYAVAPEEMPASGTVAAVFRY